MSCSGVSETSVTGVYLPKWILPEFKVIERVPLLMKWLRGCEIRSPRQWSSRKRSPENIGENSGRELRENRHKVEFITPRFSLLQILETSSMARDNVRDILRERPKDVL